ncbi:MAG: transposase [Candidatus Omnitrophota bacterium]
MPSYARKHQLTRSLLYHVFSRSNARLPIFRQSHDFSHFITLLKGYAEAFSLTMYHWVIMSNHYHLLLEIPEPEQISRCMAGIARAYTHYYHKNYQTSGYLWQGRFKLQPIEKERYLLACGRYIERNPVRAGIVAVAELYPYSSAAYYCIGKADEIVTESPAYFDFGRVGSERREEYKKFLLSFNEEEERLFRNCEHPQGSEEFKRRLIKENGRYMPRRKGKPRKD